MLAAEVCLDCPHHIQARKVCQPAAKELPNQDCLLKEVAKRDSRCGIPELLSTRPRRLRRQASSRKIFHPENAGQRQQQSRMRFHLPAEALAPKMGFWQ